MFISKTQKIQKITNFNPTKIEELELLLNGTVNMYIDYANILPWKNSLGWDFDLKRLKQFLESFDNIKSNKIYIGTLLNDSKSISNINKIKSLKYTVITKPVKIIKYQIDTSSIIDMSSIELIKNLLKRPYLRIMSNEGIIANNNELKKLNEQKIIYLEDKKCNFDVEMGRDLLKDYLICPVDIFVIWTSDSDFEEPISQLLKDGKKVILFSTAGKPARELNELRKIGLVIYDIKKIKNYICRNRDLDEDCIQSKEDPSLDPQATD
jgi:uncharacterized LabA/DUF88 family protein